MCDSANNEHKHRNTSDGVYQLHGLSEAITDFWKQMLAATVQNAKQM